MPTTLIPAERRQGSRSQAADRRREPRFGADGEVTMVVAKAQGQVEIRAELMDFSLTGLRVRHRHKQLKTGEQVSVFFTWGEVTTRVMWNRTDGDGFEAGLKLF
ncbi:MAG TPA: PilZ domain-containing protein [Terriglobales bacterium]|nr:PilZ domain-containing protein [Terriglobales bacterium]